MRRTRRAPVLRPVPLLAWLSMLGLALAAGVIGAQAASSAFDLPPRELAQHLVHRFQGAPRPVEGVVRSVAGTLERLDRGEPGVVPPLRLRVGAQAHTPATARAGERLVPVRTVEHALAALGEAVPGDVIEFAPGTYRFDHRAMVAIDRPGTVDAPITVRAGGAGDVVLEFAMSEGFRVTAPYRRFENLVVRGVCVRHADCEHAFHVVGGAHHFVLANTTLSDFNAHVKANGERGRFPDDGLIEGNTLVNTAPRQTASPVAPIDAVGVSRWTVRANLIADFVKAQGNRISYAAFAKGGGAGNRFERNVVLCEWKLRGAAGWRVGLSLGGGGTSVDEFCRDRSCALEQEGGVIESNLIAACSDDGIYVNRAAGSRIAHNTLIDTGGIVVRFPESSAEVEGNLVDGTIRERDGALVYARDNVAIRMAFLYAGRHAPRTLFQDALALDLRWRQAPPRRADATAVPDLCGSTRPAVPAHGAFEDFAACLDEPAGTLRACEPNCK